MAGTSVVPCRCQKAPTTFQTALSASQGCFISCSRSMRQCSMRSRTIMRTCTLVSSVASAFCITAQRHSQLSADWRALCMRSQVEQNWLGGPECLGFLSVPRLVSCGPLPATATLPACMTIQGAASCRDHLSACCLWPSRVLPASHRKPMLCTGPLLLPATRNHRELHARTEKMDLHLLVS